MDNPKTTQAHNTSLTGAVDFDFRYFDGVHPSSDMLYRIHRDMARTFVYRFCRDNPDIHLSDAQWTKLIDALSNG